MNRYRRNADYETKLQEAISGKTGDEADEALESFLEFVRQWLTFKAPRLIASIGRIQAEILQRHGMAGGNYAFFCSQLESLFMNPVIMALEEYGVPVQLAARLVPKLGNPTTLDDALAALGQRRTTELGGLSRFEQALVRPLCADAPQVE